MVTVRSLLTTAEDLVKDERHHEAAQHYIEIAEYNSPHRYPVDGYYLQSYLHNGGDVAAGLYLYCRSITLANAPALAAQAYYKMGIFSIRINSRLPRPIRYGKIQGVGLTTGYSDIGESPSSHHRHQRRIKSRSCHR